jgi:tetratricopeptide (TPR) repeat protein
MWKWSILTVATMALFGLQSCGDQSGTDTGKEIKFELITDAEKHQRMLVSIDSMEQLLYADSLSYDLQLMEKLRESYDEFGRRFAGDKAKTPEYLYKSAAMSRGMGQPMAAIKTYDLILRKFKNFERAPEVQFLIAFTYDEDLKEKALAKDSYRDVMDKFPGDLWAIQAEQRLQTIDMTDGELIEFFMKKQTK